MNKYSILAVIFALFLALAFAGSIGDRIGKSAIKEVKQGNVDVAIEETLARLSKK